MSQRKPDWDIDLRNGQQGEQLVEALLGGSRTVEVKTDFKAVETGNLFIETACRTSSGDYQHYYPSGISTTKADYYAFIIRTGDDISKNTVVLIPTERLKQYVKDCISAGKNLRELKRGSHPTKGVILKVKDILSLSVDEVSNPEGSPFAW